MAVFKWHSPGWQWESTYIFSASRQPPSNIENSYGTPVGWHRICEKIGDNIPVSGIFVARKFTGRVALLAKTQTARAYVTTRILRLEGCSWGINKGKTWRTHQWCDSRKRCIYIHGTNLEVFIPQPLSKGCLLLKTRDLLALYSQVHCGDLCFITAEDL